MRSLLGLPGAELADRYIFEAPASAPDLLNVEIVNVLRRYERQREFDERVCREALAELALLPVARYPTLELAPRAWALRRNMTAYDAVYVALAEALDTEFVTADARLARAARDHADPKVILLE